MEVHRRQNMKEVTREDIEKAVEEYKKGLPKEDKDYGLGAIFVGKYGGYKERDTL